MDDALALDERNKRFRQQAMANKNKKKNEREAQAKKEAEEKQQKAEVDAKLAKEAEEASKAERAEGKKAKEAAKQAVKKNKRILKGSVKDVNYFAEGGDAGPAQVDGVLSDVDLLMSKIDPSELATLASKLSIAGKDTAGVKAAYTEELKRLVDAGNVKDSELKVIGK